MLQFWETGCLKGRTDFCFSLHSFHPFNTPAGLLNAFIWWSEADSLNRFSSLHHHGLTHIVLMGMLSVLIQQRAKEARFILLEPISFNSEDDRTFLKAVNILCWSALTGHHRRITFCGFVGGGNSPRAEHSANLEMPQSQSSAWICPEHEHLKHSSPKLSNFRSRQHTYALATEKSSPEPRSAEPIAVSLLKRNSVSRFHTLFACSLLPAM